VDVEQDVDLLARAQRGDRDAFAELYDRHVRPVYWQTYSMVRDRESAEDATQEVFVTAWRRVRSINCVDNSVLPWLLVTAKYVAFNLSRREARRSHDDLNDEAAGPASTELEAETRMLRDEIAKAVHNLSPVDQQLYALCLEGGATYEQAAAELGVSHSSVRNRLHRLRASLRADLQAVRGDA
jgi:RNA polymerase sigma-70 factor (ECF subfamily)